MGIKMKLFKKSDKLTSTDQLIVPKKSKKKKIIKIAAVLIVLILIISVVYNRSLGKKAVLTGAESGSQIAKVEKRDIQSILSSSGTIEPLNKYDVKTLIEGEVISADFDEGDQVKKDDVLYQVTTDDIDSKIKTSKTSVERAKDSYKTAVDNYDKAVKKYNDALADYNDAEEEYSDLAIKTKKTGIVKKVYVEEGDKIQIGTQIADIYDNSSMLLEIPFNSADVSSSLIGKTAKIELTDGNETLEGKVTKVSSIEDVLSGNRVVKKVTIEVKNPGGLTANTSATASIGDLYSSGDGTFSVLEESTITADKAGEIHSLNIEEGEKINTGNTVIILDSDTYKDQLDSYQKALDSAEDVVDNAKNSVKDAKDKIEDSEDSLDDVIDNKTDYSITAPISGQVVSKDVLAGDTISRESTTKLCTIYDLSAVTFDMQIDELDIMKVKVGQKVNITADALEGETFTGEVTNISLESTTKEGVTQYPVTVRINEVGDLLPGMNVDGKIILDEVSGVLAIPSDALMRGDVVYVKDDSVKEAVGDIPAGFKEVEVKTGLSDDNYTEITNGLTGNEEVYVKRNATGFQMMPGQYGPGGETRGQGDDQGEARQGNQQARAASRP
ncbi:efflux RND transporter periplasmic adaptor subunit [Anaerocolumna sp. MB42-C2]|uniref:efflux RND transporter periplasmic adaptor subunit n=1 Tax=Anaerocolumna sp. MB42-C2 TaxID=3070997 RepID=UPI0027E10899|nr:efflux RND transporter periplasmic adaptor subunit [Anaerocolumna sp. MB42-C2]WMJ88101.1 efflux RND transporter periplasmic adaptor subunit [Anaerocolumna sp. MB42-C2]